MTNYALALRFPLLALEALAIDAVNDLVIVVSARNTVVAASTKCLEKGIEPGMPVNTAELILNCKRVERNTDKETALLTRICDALYAFTPYIQRYNPNEKLDSTEQGLLLELTRSIRLFKGLPLLLEQIVTALNDMGLCFFAALGHSGKAAWLLSYQSEQPNQVIPLYKGGNEQGYKKSIESLIAHIQIKHLQAFPEEANELLQAGFVSFSDLRRQIQREGLFPLQKRFKPAFIYYLQEVGGDWLFSNSVTDGPSPQQTLFPLASPRAPAVVYEPETVFVENIEFDWPLSSIELLHEPMKMLLQRLCSYLVSYQLQCHGVTWHFSDIYQNTTSMNVRSERIYRDWLLLYELSLIQLESQGLPFEINLLEISQPLLSPVHFEAAGLTDDTKQALVANKHVQRMIARIQARVGENNVFKLSLKDEHVPELSQQKVASHHPICNSLPESSQYAERPSWLLNKPVPIGKHQNDLFWRGRIQLIRGPEKLSAHWWDKPVERDYFTAVRDDHVRLWVFYDVLKSEWCVQGIF